MITSRTDCVRADETDPLAGFRDEFELPGGVIYLDGNSLGAKPKAASRRVAEVVDAEWGTGLIRSWNTAGWFDLPGRLGDQLAEVIGGGSGETVVTDTTSTNLFKALAAALRSQAEDDPGRRVILSERDNFPTDLYLAEGMIEFLDRGYRLAYVDDHPGAAGDLAGAISGDVAVLLLSHVNYRTGAMWDLPTITAEAHRSGALVIWDLAHSAGAVPVDLTAAGADLAVGCTYKYLNGGPGSPGFIWVAAHLQDRFWQPLTGWWGHARPFAMEPSYAAATGIGKFLCGTQPIVSLALAECGLAITRRADADLLRRKSLALGDLFIALVEQRCGEHPLTLVTPREHRRRGSHLSFRHPEGFAVTQALIERGVIGDYREPEVLRFGLTPLYLGYADIWDAVQILATVLDTAAWDTEAFRHRAAVT